MVKIKLRYPVEYDGKNIDYLELKRPKGKHLKTLPVNPSTKDMIHLAAKLSGEPTPVFDEMDAVDIIAVSETIAGFLDRGQETGAS